MIDLTIFYKKIDMGCACKNSGNSSEMKEIKTKDDMFSVGFLAKIFFFLLLVIVSPIFLGVIIWVLFRALFLDKPLDILPLVKKMANLKLFDEEDEYDDEDDDEDEEINEDEYVAINVEDITNKDK